MSDSIRAATVADAVLVATLLRQAFQEFESLYTPEAFSATTPAADEIRRRLEEGPVWVALRADTVVGTVSAVPRGDELYLRSMAVSPVVRGQGIGRQLLDRVQRFAAERGYRRMRLTTTPFLSQAIQLYERAGFRRGGGEIAALHGTPLLGMVKDVERLSEATGGQGIPGALGGAPADRVRERWTSHYSALLGWPIPAGQASVASSTPNEVRRLVVRWYEEMWNRWDYALVDELVAPAISFRGSLGKLIKGREAFKDYMRSVQSAFPDFRNRIDELIVDDRSAAVRLTYSGTHRGEVLGLQPTGREVTYAGAAFLEVASGRFVRGWVLGDLVGLQQQLLTEKRSPP